MALKIHVFLLGAFMLFASVPTLARAQDALVVNEAPQAAPAVTDGAAREWLNIAAASLWSVTPQNFKERTAQNRLRFTPDAHATFMKAMRDNGDLRNIESRNARYNVSEFCILSITPATGLPGHWQAETQITLDIAFLDKHERRSRAATITLKENDSGAMQPFLITTYSERDISANPAGCP